MLSSGNDSPQLLSKEEKRRLKKEKKRKRKEISSATPTPTNTIPRTSLQHDDSGAYFEVQALRIQVALLPHSLGDGNPNNNNVYSRVLQSVRHGLLFKYHPNTRGIIMAFRGLHLTREGKGWIRNELPHIHFSAEAQVLVFCPTIGMELTGVVNESFSSHLGILVFSLLNASVSADHLHQKGYSYNSQNGKWAKLHQEKDGFFDVDSLVKFRIERIHEVGGEISMDGMEPVFIKPTVHHEEVP